MATPYCQKYQAFATQRYCGQTCGRAEITRRPPCIWQRPRRWDDVPADTREDLQGCACLNRLHRRLDRIIKRHGKGRYNHGVRALNLYRPHIETASRIAAKRLEGLKGGSRSCDTSRAIPAPVRAS